MAIYDPPYKLEWVGDVGDTGSSKPSDNDIIQFNATTQRWDFVPGASIGGGFSVAFDAYDGAGGQTLTSMSQTVTLPTERINTGEFVLSSNEVTFNETGSYKIDFGVTVEAAVAVDIEVWLEKNGSMVPGSTRREQVAT